MNQKTENWRAVLELEASDGPPLPMKTTAQLLAAMMLRGTLDALDERGDDGKAETLRDL